MTDETVERVAIAMRHAIMDGLVTDLHRSDLGDESLFALARAAIAAHESAVNSEELLALRPKCTVCDSTEHLSPDFGVMWITL